MLHKSSVVNFPWFRDGSSVISGTANLADSGFTQTVLMVLPWPIFGLIGGLAIDGRWGGKVHGVAISVIAAALIYGLILALTRELATRGEMLSQLSVAAGWSLVADGLFLLPYPHAPGSG